MYKQATAQGGWGHAWGQIVEFNGYEIASETILYAKTMLLGGQTTELHMYDCLPFLPKWSRTSSEYHDC